MPAVTAADLLDAWEAGWDRTPLERGVALLAAAGASAPAQLPVGRAVWQPRPDFQTAVESWLRSGGPHHTTLSTAIDTEAMIDLAEILRTELVVIDEQTTSRAFATELRWSQAYHRLAQGL